MGLSLVATLASLNIGASAQTPGGADIRRSETPGLGGLLTDRSGKTLYSLLTDSLDPKVANAALAECPMACKSRFRPVYVARRPVGLNVIPGYLGTIRNRVGRMQATYKRWPLYTLDYDMPGQADGQRFLNVAFIMSPIGEPLAQRHSASPLRVAATIDAALMATGRDLYQQNCTGCHGAEGRGGFGPAFVGNAGLVDEWRLIRAILIGSGDMPPFGKRFSDRDVASIASWVRASWATSLGEFPPIKSAINARRLPCALFVQSLR